MTLRLIAFILIVVLLALMWWAKDWLMWHWQGLDMEKKAAWMIGASFFFLFALAHILKPLFIIWFF